MLNKLTNNSMFSTLLSLMRSLNFDKLKNRIYLVSKSTILNVLQSATFIPAYYRMNEKIWLEGLLVD